jgi:hypothetical protein
MVHRKLVCIYTVYALFWMSMTLRSSVSVLLVPSSYWYVLLLLLKNAMNVFVICVLVCRFPFSLSLLHTHNNKPHSHESMHVSFCRYLHHYRISMFPYIEICQYVVACVFAFYDYYTYQQVSQIFFVLFCFVLFDESRLSC